MLPGITRREFLSETGKNTFRAGTAYLLLSQLGWLTEILSSTDRAYAMNKLDLLAQSAPLARYWVSASHPPENTCTECHTDDDWKTDLSHHHHSRVVKCLLCAQSCMIKSGERGRCRTRINSNGELRTLVYGRPISIHIDPIEKKPFYHFLPGSAAYSLATSGCPLQCQFCQNWEISQCRPEDYEVDYTPPGTIVKSADSEQVPVIAFTYNEPTVFIEYLTDIARAARSKGLRSVMISCGFMNPQPLTELCETLDAIKIDLKGYSDEFYRKVCSAELKPVLRTIKQIARSHSHLEIVNLVVPTLNDSDKMMSELVEWIVNEIGPDVPVHFTRFHPDYKLNNLPPTPVATLERARAIAMDKGIRYAYVGNVPDHPGNHTYCPKCRKIVIERNGFFILANHVVNGRCEYCNEKIAGVWL